MPFNSIERDVYDNVGDRIANAVYFYKIICKNIKRYLQFIGKKVLF